MTKKIKNNKQKIRHGAVLIRESLLTEKSVQMELGKTLKTTQDGAKAGVISIRVDPRVTKTGIKKIMNRFMKGKATVEKVNTITELGRTKRNRKTGKLILGKVSKKAYVKISNIQALADIVNSNISFAEGDQ